MPPLPGTGYCDDSHPPTKPTAVTRRIPLARDFQPVTDVPISTRLEAMVSTGPVTLSQGNASHDAQDAGLIGPPRERLRIGLMLRAIDDVDGQGIYIRKLCDALFAVDPHNEYVAFYSRDDQAG